MQWLVLMLFFIALVCDTYIYRSLVCPRFRHLPARVAYIIVAAVTDAAVLSSLATYGAAADGGSRVVVTVMWLVWMFFLTFVPKAFYTLGGSLDFLVNLLSRRRVAPFRWLGIAVAVCVMVAMVGGATVGRTALRVERVEVISDRVPAAFDGYRIVQFSDVHTGTMLRPKRQLARLAEKITGLGGDVVLYTGDLVNLDHRELTPELMAVLGGISAPDGVWTVWGNHDLGFYIDEGSELTPERNIVELSEKVRSMGWTLLSDRSAWIRRGGDSLLLTGLDYPRDPMLNSHNESLAGVDISAAFDGMEGEPFNVVMAHTPKLWDEILAAGRGDVTLSGHVHAMQTKVRIFGRAWSPAQYMYKRWSGQYVSRHGEKNSVLWVNDGIGCVGYPMRMGARGEITVVTLKRCE